MHFCRYVPPWVCGILESMGGCLGCCVKSPIIVSIDDPSKRLRNPSATETKDNGSEDFWNSSPVRMDHSAGQSQRSFSSIGISNHASDPQSSSSSQIDPPEFINHGLLLWNQIRQQWIGSQKSEKQTQVREPKISGNATYESLLGTNKPFPRPVPLREMVDFLVEVWEQDGLYD
ncbi:uncharacterized protein LOC129294623 isoform X2 [Prosopis cineraria]|uniref:uncharacterized protein LOC129294623 isoform X2 n=1 Tax=Prosopis cineraria TaxID=364024 RepID=UPI0024109B31|nr:uncharacterized protein LOC129294623 isoform X2 [Prosopis cineraria]